VRDIPCGTKGGVMISFEKIEVLSTIWSTLRVKYHLMNVHIVGITY
jgi:hypothetical protein